MLTQKALLAVSRRPALRRVVVGTSFTRRVVERFVAGETLEDALRAVRALSAHGLGVSLNHLGEHVTNRAEAMRSRDAYLIALEQLIPLGLGRAAELSVKLSALGQALPDGGHDLALELVRAVAQAADAAGTTVTLDMEESRTVDSTLAILAELRRDHPGTGAALQAMLHRSEGDATALATAGSRVRLVKGAYREPPSVAVQGRRAVDAAYARCLTILMRGPGHPMVGSHDTAMIDLARQLADEQHRSPWSWEIQMLYGIRPEEQRRLAASGLSVRAYVPYGVDWYGYFTRRLAERPANLRFFLRALATRS